MRLERTFWPVGHGAFYTEQFEWPYFCAVYDCGGNPEVIGKLVKFFAKRVPLDGSRNNEKWINFLFISHFHEDHFNGVKPLLDEVHVEHIVLPYLGHLMLAEAFVYNAFVKGGKNVDVNSYVQQGILSLALNGTLYENRSIIEIGDGEKRIVSANEIPSKISSGSEIHVFDGPNHPFWEYIPVTVEVDEKKCRNLLKKLAREEASLYNDDDKTVDWGALIKIIEERGIEKVKQAYAETFGKYNEKKQKWECNHNAYSMPVFSGPIQKVGVKCWNLPYDECPFYPHFFIEECCRHKCNERLLSCLYMGDFETKEANLKKLKQILEEDYYRAGMQQVPHHFSPYNHNLELYLHRLLAFGNIDDHKDVSFCHSVNAEIERTIGTRPVVITEKDDKCYNQCYWFL